MSDIAKLLEWRGKLKGMISPLADHPLRPNSPRDVVEIVEFYKEGNQRLENAMDNLDKKIAEESVK